jgi:hypothetical protein
MEHTAHMGRQEMRTKILSESLKGRNHSGDLGIDGRIVLHRKVTYRNVSEYELG